jgi:hypothetical protein
MSAVDIGNGGIIPHEADVTLREWVTAELQDLVVLFAALLKAKGIASEVGATSILEERVH